MITSQFIKSNRVIVIAAAMALSFASAAQAQEASGSIEAASRVASIVAAYETQSPENAVTVKLLSIKGDTATFVASVPADTGHGGTCHITLVKASQANQLGWEAQEGSCKLG